MAKFKSKHPQKIIPAPQPKKYKHPFEFYESSNVPLTEDESLERQLKTKKEFDARIRPLADDELYLKFKNFLATKQALADKDPLSTLDSCRISEDLFVDEMNRRGLKMPVCYKGKVEVAEPKK